MRLRSNARYVQSMHLWTCAIIHPTLHTSSTKESNHELGPMSFTKNMNKFHWIHCLSTNKWSKVSVSNGNQNTKISTFWNPTNRSWITAMYRHLVKNACSFLVDRRKSDSDDGVLVLLEKSSCCRTHFWDGQEALRNCRFLDMHVFISYRVPPSMRLLELLDNNVMFSPFNAQ
jgi:hypothetical protein